MDTTRVLIGQNPIGKGIENCRHLQWFDESNRPHFSMHGFVSKSLQVTSGWREGWFTSFSYVSPSKWVYYAGKATENADYCLNNHCPWNSVQKSAFRMWCLPKPFKFSATSWLERNFDSKDFTTWPRYESFAREIVAAIFRYLYKGRRPFWLYLNIPIRKVELNFHANDSLCFVKSIWPLFTWAKAINTEESYYNPKMNLPWYGAGA